MNTCKRVHQKFHWFQSTASQLKASLHNRGILLVNKLVYGTPILHAGQVLYSPGGTYKYRVVGPVCRLYDRQELPWPSCNIQWKGKQPSWRRIGNRLVPDMPAKRHPSYSVILEGIGSTKPQVFTAYWVNLSAQEQEFWYSKKPQTIVQSQAKSLQQQQAKVAIQLKEAVI